MWFSRWKIPGQDASPGRPWARIVLNRRVIDRDSATFLQAPEPATHRPEQPNRSGQANTRQIFYLARYI